MTVLSELSSQFTDFCLAVMNGKGTEGCKRFMSSPTCCSSSNHYDHQFCLLVYVYLEPGWSSSWVQVLQGPAYFSAMTQGKISAFLSTMRKLVFLVGGIMIFPLFWESDGVWMTILGAEALCGALCGFLLTKKTYKK